MGISLEALMTKNESRIATLDPILACLCRMVVRHSYLNHDVPVLITQALRTIEEQNTLYAQGRTTAGNIVTNAKGGTSYHNYGYAFDIALYTPDMDVTWDDCCDMDGDGEADWDEVVGVATRLGLEWGDRGYVDKPHFQLTYGLTPKQLYDGYRPSPEEQIAVLQNAWKFGFEDEKEEIHELANQIRRENGMEES